MAKKSKLLTALDAQKGRDYEAEKRKKQLKSAEKRKRQRAEKNEENDEEDHDGVQVNGHTAPQPAGKPTDDFEAFESASEDEEDEDEGLEDSGVIPQPETVGDASASEAEQDSDISLSDLEEEDREDVVPHQRMTINNGPALVSSRKRVAVVSDIPQHPFHYHNSLVSADKIADELIPDPMDDETRELMFYKIARDATLTARGLLKKEKVPFTRPADYFAEMVKTEDHMGRVKKKLYDEAAGKKAAEEARKLRDAKKFGKQVQIAKEQERAKDKRDTLNKIQELKRSTLRTEHEDVEMLTTRQNAKIATRAESQKATICSRRSTSITTRSEEIEPAIPAASDRRKTPNSDMVERRGSQNQVLPKVVVI